MSKIIKLKSENYKKIQAIEIIPDPTTNIVTGKNGAGKSSLLDSIAWAIGGKKGVEDTPSPIRNGEEKATVTLELDNLIIKRVVTSSGERLEVVAKDGTKLSSPQKVLDELYANITFDPIKFKDLKPAEQIRVLFDSVSTDIKYDSLEADKKRLYDDRTIVNRDLKKYTSQISSFYVDESELNMVKPDASNLISRISNAQELQATNTLIETKYFQTAEKYKSIKAQIDLLQKQLEEVKAEGLKYKDQIEKLTVPEDITPLKNELATIEQSQNKYRKIQDYIDLRVNIETLSKQSNSLSEEITAIEQRKLKILETSNLPIKGLTFSDEGLIYKGIPFSQCCSSDKLMISTVISCVLNKELKAILIRDGSLLDKDNFNQIQRIAKHYDMQIWIEKVDETGEIGIIIEDGKIKEQI